MSRDQIEWEPGFSERSQAGIYRNAHDDHVALKINRSLPDLRAPADDFRFESAEEAKAHAAHLVSSQLVEVLHEVIDRLQEQMA